MAHRYLLEHPDVVEAEEVAIILGLSERDPVLGRFLAEGAAVQRFAVGDDAVEIEDDGGEWHVVSLTGKSDV